MIKLVHAVNQCLRLAHFDSSDIVFIDKTSLVHCHELIQNNPSDNAISVCLNNKACDYLSTSLSSYVGARHIVVSTEDKAITKLIIHGGQFSSYEVHVHPFSIVPVEDEITTINQVNFSTVEYEIGRWLFKANSLATEDIKILLLLLYHNYNVAEYQHIFQFLNLIYYNPDTFMQLDKVYKGYLAQIIVWCELDTPKWLLEEV